MSDTIRKLKMAPGSRSPQPQPPVTPFIDGQDPFDPFVPERSYLNQLHDLMYRKDEQPAAFELLPPAQPEGPPPPDSPYYKQFIRPRVI
jgi:hypothetical protein